MLIRRDFLERIAAGDVDLAFRVWKRPTVKIGGKLRTSVGELEICDLTEIDRDALTEKEAKRAGYNSLEALKSDLAIRPQGRLYRISIRLAGADARIALRNADDLTDHHCNKLLDRLRRRDECCPKKPLAVRIISFIDRHPGSPARQIADHVGMDKPVLKRYVLRLKEEGLTESLQTGYRLSPRGKRVLGFASREFK
ncbi:MAG: winged helix-turn-helix transcriptional regulator [Pseudomonadota bacterium]